MISTFPALADLQSQWHNLSDLDRAKAVRAIKHSGIPIRTIAFDLNCSEALIRHLLAALQAPPQDQFLARQGQLSTNELVRRARKAGIHNDAYWCLNPVATLAA